MTYRGYELEEKTMKAGCQIVILKDGAFVRNSSVVKEMKDAVAEAHAYIDHLLTPAPGENNRKDTP
jgi:hypothetical protein